MGEIYPKISIITPSYNQAAFIERTILSVIGQNYPNFEYLVIDGGSTDGSVEIIKKYEAHITFWLSEKDKGTYDANNKALKAVTGDYWCVVNSDDLLAPGALMTVYNNIKNNPSQKWFAGAVDYIDEKDIFIGEQPAVKPEAISGFTFLNGCWTSHPGVFLSTEIFKEIGGFNKFHLMDLDYWLRMEAKGYQPLVINERLASLRLHQDCKSSDRIKLQGEFINVLNSFIQKNKLEKNSAVLKSFNEHLLNYERVLLFEQLVHGKSIDAVKKLLYISYKFPRVVFAKWYWGAVKRIVVGVRADDPLQKEFARTDNKSNWNNLND